MVPADMTAWRCVPGRASGRPRSIRTMRGEGSANRPSATGQHAPTPIEGPSRKLGIRARAARSIHEPVVRRQLVHSHGGHRLLGQHVQRVLLTPSARCGPHYMPSAATAVDDLGAGAREDEPIERPPTWWFARPMRGSAGLRLAGPPLQHEIDGSMSMPAPATRCQPTTRQLARFRSRSPAGASPSTPISEFALRDDGRCARGHVRRGAGPDRRMVAMEASISARARCPPLRVQIVQARRRLLAQPARVHETRW